MGTGISFVDTGLDYTFQGLHFIKDILLKIANWIPLGSPEIIVTVIFLTFSLWIGNLLTRKFIVSPFSLQYIIYTLIISASIFLNLMYL